MRVFAAIFGREQIGDLIHHQVGIFLTRQAARLAPPVDGRYKEREPNFHRQARTLSAEGAPKEIIFRADDGNWYDRHCRRFEEKGDPGPGAGR